MTGRVFLLRGFLIASGALVLFFALVGAAAGSYRGALSGALGGIGLVLLGTWAWGYPTAAFPLRMWLSLGLMAASIAVLFGPVGAVGAVVFLAVLLVGNVATGRRMMRGLREIEFERLEPDAPMSKLEETAAAEFETEGFRHVGAVRWRIPVSQKVTTDSLMLGRHADRFAVAGQVCEVVSRFGDRWLTTSSSGLMPEPTEILRQTIVQGRPGALAAAHQSALQLVAARGLEPDRFTEDGEIVDALEALHERSISFISSGTVRKLLLLETQGKSSRDPVLGDDERSRRRIDAWLDAQPSLD
jgi:hypothetical protein